MRPVNLRFFSILSLKFPIALLVLGLVLAAPPPAGAEGSFGIAALPPQRPFATGSSEPRLAESRSVGVPRTRPEALALMHRVASQLEGQSAAGSGKEQLMTELEAALRFSRKLDRGSIHAASFQWHRTGTAELATERGRAFVRPLSGIRYASAVAISTSGGGADIDRIRVFSASGMVFEFGTDRRAAEKRGDGEVYLLERELELVGVEVMYRLRPGSAAARLAIEAGICVEPRYAAECAYRLQLARQSAMDGQFAAARERVRESIALLSAVR